MAKSRAVFLCGACGSSHPKWAGKCPDCGAWDSLERYHPPADAAEGGGEVPAHLGAAAGWLGDHDVSPAAKAVPLSEVESLAVPRIPTGIAELDRVLGGGLVPASAVLLGGEPGIGKSTLLLQAMSSLAADGRRVLYVSSEESGQQVKLRAERIASPAGGAERETNLFVLSETNLARIAEQTRRTAPDVLVVDSVQMLYRADLEASPGSMTQLRRCCLELVMLAKASGIAVIVVGHVTKDGDLAGPKLLEHLVDVVLQFEGDRHHAHRVVRAIKNRFGSTHEIGLFEMTGGGLAEIEEGSLALGDDPRPGSVFVPALAGSRVLVAEVQALTATGFLGTAKRRASGIDPNRLAMSIAVLEKHGDLRLADQDIFAAVAGGIRLTEPAADLALLLAVAGAYLGRTVPSRFAAIGEVGLSGEIRPIRFLEQRLNEVARRGGHTVAVPAGQVADVASAARKSGVTLVGVATVAAGVELLVPRKFPREGQNEVLRADAKTAEKFAKA
jgi:DNA repair protein RadA/Sms